MEESDRPIHIIIDKEGRAINFRTGEVVRIPSRVPTLQANLRIQKKDVNKQEQPKITAAKEVGIEHPGLDASASFFDARIGTHPAVRNRRHFSFNEKGKHIEQANRERAKAKLEKLQAEISRIAKTTGIAIENQAAIIRPKKFFSELDVPDIERWDSAILQQNNYSSITPDAELTTTLTGITRLVEHPIQVKPPWELVQSKPVLLPFYLTKREQRKLRRQNRAQVLKERQEKIRLGLIKAPEPKVKINNIMRVLCSEAVQDPTKTEEHVRNQMAQRIKTHEETNAARKLTAKQRRHEKNKRQNKDVVDELHVAVYRLPHLNDPANKFKVETNCKQLHMTGCVVSCKDVNIIVVEGGAKQQNKYRRLLLHRIKWNSFGKHPIDDQKTNEEGEETNQRKLIWQGPVMKRAFGEIKFIQFQTQNIAREYFRRHGVEHYWNIAAQ